MVWVNAFLFLVLWAIVLRKHLRKEEPMTIVDVGVLGSITVLWLVLTFI